VNNYNLKEEQMNKSESNLIGLVKMQVLLGLSVLFAGSVNTLHAQPATETGEGSPVSMGTLREEPLLKDGHRVLFIGNSYTFYHGGLPKHLKLACAAADEPLNIETEMLVAPSKELKFLFENTDAVEKIRTGNWDLVILQGGYNAPILKEKNEQFKDSVRRFTEVIRESGAEPVIWAVWEQKFHKTAWNIWRRIDSITRAIAEELEIPVVPIGTIWAGIRRSGLEGLDMDGEKFLYHDGVHPTELAVHMNTLAFYSFLTGRSCVGFNFKDGNKQIKDPAVAAAVQKAVWDVIRAELK
jgi:hypothetical protein